MEVPSSEVEKKCPSPYGSSSFWAEVHVCQLPLSLFCSKLSLCFQMIEGHRRNVLRTLTTVLDREGQAVCLVQPRSACPYVMVSPFNLM